VQLASHLGNGSTVDHEAGNQTGAVLLKEDMQNGICVNGSTTCTLAGCSAMKSSPVGRGSHQELGTSVGSDELNGNLNHTAACDDAISEGSHKMAEILQSIGITTRDSGDADREYGLDAEALQSSVATYNTLATATRKHRLDKIMDNEIKRMLYTMVRYVYAMRLPVLRDNFHVYISFIERISSHSH
jgi:hypothetical protein